MENASKALIIAGAILLSVLIISLGIMVFQNAKNTVGSTNLSKQEIETFNSQWQAYEGTNKTASEVRTMIQAVIANNAAEEKSGTGRKIQVTDNGTAVTTATTPTTNSSLATSLTNSKTYTISLGYGTNGLVVGISFNK